MKEGATLVLKKRLTIEGTKERPVRFLPAAEAQVPWGAIVLMGEDAAGSKLENCEMVGGSGLKGDLFEYTGMLSIQDVAGVLVRNCTFRDNAVVDDMVHVVYSNVDFENVIFTNSNSDALDIDISSASIDESLFENSGNDAVDLMSSVVRVTNSTLVGNGDKGVSVGEGSRLLAVNDEIVNNAIGVQSKDGSFALLVNLIPLC